MSRASLSVEDSMEIEWRAILNVWSVHYHKRLAHSKEISSRPPRFLTTDLAGSTNQRKDSN